jgi:hypothetical protein
VPAVSRRADGATIAVDAGATCQGSGASAELVISNSRFFSLRVGLLASDGTRISRLPTGEPLSVHAELIYENGQPVVRGSLEDAPDKTEGPEPALDGSTCVQLSNGEVRSHPHESESLHLCRRARLRPAPGCSTSDTHAPLSPAPRPAALPPLAATRRLSRRPPSACGSACSRRARR